MKFLLIAFALIGIAAAALPDSATQGPNPQDIATPEPEYIDIDLPEPPKAAPAPAPVQRSFSAPRPVPQPITNQFSAPSFPHRFAAPQQHQVQQAAPVSFQQRFAPQQQQHAAQSAILQRFAPQLQQQQQPQVSAHNFNFQSGYQYRRPVYVRRVYYHRRF